MGERPLEEMENGGVKKRAARYLDEDVSPTSDMELRGFYTYQIAAECFVICGMGCFLPLALEQLAREQGVLYDDRTVPCQARNDVVRTATHALLARAASSTDSTHQCVVNIFGATITSASFAMYNFSLAVFIQALTLVSISSVADYGTYRKKFLLAFAYTGATACMLFVFVIPEIYLVAVILTIISVTCLGCSFTLLNSFLPLLVSNHPDVQDYATDSDEGDSSFSSQASKSDFSQLSTQISSRGVGLGYMAGLTSIFISIGILFLMKKTDIEPSIPLRSVLFFVGICWFSFTVPASLWIKNRPGPPLAPGMSSHSCKSVWGAALAYNSFAWRGLWKTAKIALKLKQLGIFLVGWFLVSDAMTTLSTTSVILGRTELQMDSVGLALLVITVTGAGMVGAFTWPKIARRYQLKPNHVIVACVCLGELVPLYGFLAYVPLFKSWGWGGYQNSLEMYPAGFLHGFVMGGLFSYARSFYGQLIPPGSEAAFYALMAITDKGSSAIGPTIVGTIVNATGQIRPAFGFICVLIMLPIPLFCLIDAETGREDALNMAELMRNLGDLDVEMADRGDGEVGEAERLMQDSTDADAGEKEEEMYEGAISTVVG